jgi:hypothetical protein
MPLPNPHCTENLIYLFSEKEFRGLSSDSYIHVSDLYFPRIGPHIWLQQNRQADPRNCRSTVHMLEVYFNLLFLYHILYVDTFQSCFFRSHLRAWMKEAMDNTSRVGVCLRCPVFISVHFSLRNEGSSEYIRLCEGRESLSPNFQTFHDPRHQFHGISTLVSETLHPLATLALLHMIPWTFLHSLNV